MLDPTSPNNKNIFIDTNLEISKSQRIQDEYVKVHNKKITQLLIAKTKSNFLKMITLKIFLKEMGLLKFLYKG